ncbi:MAG: glycoside hydrolase family 2 TIM barrel-domain containing protein, partial [Acutalibacteraceae bacterium]|nr:glycoside hydrolase family 2 TIM barrel-domain containing protein [Acutalibacteraceae bacterium]
IPHSEYPRPQLVRDSYFCLNGEWDFAVTRGDAPENYDRKIIVPYPPQSVLSGIDEVYEKGDVLFYKRNFTLPDGFIKNRVILHIGATDQIATVFLNGVELGAHVGGYFPFSFDITDALQDENTLVVRVEDNPLDTTLPYGKQRAKRGGMWYTPVSGIWQTVWCESVPENYIKSIKIDADDKEATIKIEGVNEGILTLRTDDGLINAEIKDGVCKISPCHPIVWTPENPHLYRFKITAGEDEVASYFALRKISIENVRGIPRICLNGEPFFFHGLLDQGYFSDGIFTPADDKGFENDILSMKALGFNTLRKHIKIEPEQFYYDCDRLGMIVFQDMVNCGKYSFLRDTALPTVFGGRRRFGVCHKSKKMRKAFIDTMEKTVKTLYNHPSICLWTIFNEGWGQFKGDEMYKHMRTLDTSRIIDTASGWFFCKESDIISPHVYFKKLRVKPQKKPVLVSEFGGYAHAVEGHIFNTEKAYGYSTYKNLDQLQSAIKKLYENEVIPAVPYGLCGAIYTQVSDVEDEINGILTYDRRICKLKAEDMLPIAETLKKAIK